MFDIGWTELVVIAIVLIVVVGPKDLPPMLRAFGRMTSKMRGMAADFRHQFDEALREADLDEVRKTISDAQSLNPTAALRDAMNPLRQLGNEIKSDLQKATTPDKPAPPEPVQPAVEPVKAEAPVETAAKLAEVPAASANEPKMEAKAKSVGKVKAAPAPSKKPAAATTRKAATKPPAKKASSTGERQPEAKTQKARATSRKKGDA
ncbi:MULTISPECIES: Sec-independent protein translocase protein TatB [unclassified Sinorhizobium]|uniref:Sec-independent protein translocase protein TatB n=1 Tax=unclassified Sinorhizobium TaxID=2613772 RepID=UPI0024C2A5B6|nr:MULTISPECIES: Sec-independent protein translocase protein TatB [unclassified Sinorhizobium]MDK1376619.1 Sec-independent protein translocase protein TatB [Sinorhizobium sp. 6-70]MDK1477103.1 Sec-independent protein translocase protein TatB [Sinorhizobium sp. 6-117]MDK1477228.1 Sec-independent protein translocase protein TatB [Sinorhizobium sp. 6-117]